MMMVIFFLILLCIDNLVGSLNFLTITQPNISFFVQQVNQFMQAPTHLHLTAIRYVIRYLQGTSDRGLFFPVGTSIFLVTYSNADWLVVLILDVLLLVGACSLVTLLYHGKARSKIEYLNLQLSRYVLYLFRNCLALGTIG